MPTTALRVVYIVPSRYDDEGYVRRYWRGVLPSNTLSVLKSLTEGLAQSGTLGHYHQVHVETYDELVRKVPSKRMVRKSQRRGGRLLVGLVGVQTNMFARATDLAMMLRDHGVPVAIGGFHVSGVLKLFPEIPQDLEALMAAGEMKKVHRCADAPDLTGAPIPLPDPDYLKHFAMVMGTLDTSRSCPEWH